MFHETKIIQRKLLLSTLLSVYLVSGFASPGDELVITGDLVNFRSAASSNSAVTTKLPRASKLVKTGRRDIKTAWVHGYLLSRTTETKNAGEQRAAPYIFPQARLVNETTIGLEFPGTVYLFNRFQN